MEWLLLQVTRHPVINPDKNWRHLGSCSVHLPKHQCTPVPQPWQEGEKKAFPPQNRGGNPSPSTAQYFYHHGAHVYGWELQLWAAQGPEASCLFFFFFSMHGYSSGVVEAKGLPVNAQNCI